MAKRETLEDYQAQQEREGLAEVLAGDPIRRTCRYVAFVSKSKGIRNGKQRLRRNCKEIRLVKYLGMPVTQWHRFPFDECATEIFGASVSPDYADATLRELLPERAKKGVKV